MPNSVRLGFYTIGFNDSLSTVGSDVGDGWISGSGEKHVAQSICDLGHYCAADGSTFAHLVFTVDSNRRKKIQVCGGLVLRGATALLRAYPAPIAVVTAP